jgi:hypothetical protein
MLDVRCSTFNLFTVPARRSFIRGSRNAEGREEVNRYKFENEDENDDEDEKGNDGEGGS